MRNLLYLTMVMALITMLLFSWACEKDDDGVTNESTALVVPDDFGSIQEAIDASENEDIITVKPGVYRENINFNGKEVTVQSTNPEDNEVVESTIIDGQENDCVVKIENGEGEGTVLSGFTIKNGSARDGAGIYIDNYSSPTIKYNIITENICGRGGGGGAFVTNGSSPKFKYNIFDNNINGRTTSRSGLGLFVRNESDVEIIDNEFINHDGCRGVIAIGLGSDDNSNATISNNKIEDNISEYGTGGIAVNGSTATISENIINNNTGGGSGVDAGGAFSIRSEANVDITDNEITDNWATNAGAVAVGGESVATITNNIISGNSSGEEGTLNGTGGGVFIDDATATISSNSITNNTAWNTNTGGGGIYVRNSVVTIENNDIENNRATRSGGGIYLRGHGTTSTLDATVINNNIAGNESKGHSSANGGGINIGFIQSATVYGNTLTDNYAEQYGGGIYIDEGTPIFGENNVEWNRMNYPPETEIYNNYDNNTHGDDEFHGAHVFFTDFSK